MPELVHFERDWLENDIETTRWKVRISLPLTHPLRSETPIKYPEEHAPKRLVLKYEAVAREFAFFVRRRHQESGGAPTYPYGPIGLSSDGLLVALGKNPSGRINLWARNIDDGDTFCDSWHGHYPDAGPITVETDLRFAVTSRALGKATLSPYLQIGRSAPWANVDVSRYIDYSAVDYKAGYADVSVPPIGALRGGSGAQPILPLEAFIDLGFTL